MTIFISPEIIFQMGIDSNHISMNWQFDLKKNNVTYTNSFCLNHYLINDDYLISFQKLDSRKLYYVVLLY